MEGQSLHSAKEFLLRQTRSLRQRRSALRAASLQWHQDLRRAQGTLQDPDSSQLLQGMRHNLEEVSPGCCLCSGVRCHTALAWAPDSAGPVGVGSGTLWEPPFPWTEPALSHGLCTPLPTLSRS